MNYYRCLTIIGVIVVATIVFAIEQSQHTTFGHEWGATPPKIFDAASHIRHGSFSKEDARQFATLITHQFLHGDIQHILFNMIFLWIFGTLNCRILGQWQTLAAFFVCGAAGAIVQGLVVRDGLPLIGASGAISGLEGLFVGLALRWELPDAEVWPLAYSVTPQQFVVVALIGFGIDLFLLSQQRDNIAHGAHLGGVLTGLAIAGLITTIYPTLNAYNRALGRTRN
jgi:membrane associated rhomboid family serine protease